MQRDFTYSVWWNLLLITVGSAIMSFGYMAVAIPKEFVTGGIGGLGMLMYYITGKLSPAIWLLILSVPLFLFAWFEVSKRFFWYSLYGTLIVSFFMEVFTYTIAIENYFLSAIAGGCLIGAGAGIILRSLGSSGGMDIVAIILNKRFGLRIGQVHFIFNVALLGAALLYLDLERTLYSLVMIFIVSQIVDYFMGLFNQRKFAIIISEKSNEVSKAITDKLHRGCTILHGQGAYTGKPREVLLTVVNNFEVKRLEEVVYTADPKAFTIISNAINVLGYKFSKRKVY